MQEFFLKHAGDWTSLILRLTAGTIMFPHGLQKVSAFKSTMDYFTGSMRLPWIVAFLVIAIEVLAPIGLIAGVFARICAAALIAVMTGAIVTTNARHGFFMNWYGMQQGEGFEYHLLFIGICLAIIVNGSGKFSINRM